MMLPEIALSIRQPWAWAIFNGKDVENRTPAAIKHFPKPICRRIAVHASKGLTRSEYIETAAFIERIGLVCPPAAELARGGIIGSVDVVDVVKEHDSKWFFGPRALVLRNAEPCEFIPAVGALGYFRWQRSDPSIVPMPCRWMLPTRPSIRAADPAPDLFA